MKINLSSRPALDGFTSAASNIIVVAIIVTILGAAAAWAAVLPTVGLLYLAGFFS